MARLVYPAITSLDGYVADGAGGFDRAAPDEEVHAAVNDVLRPVGTSLHGRRMYDVLVAWETLETTGEPDVVRDFAPDLAVGRQGGPLHDPGRGCPAPGRGSSRGSTSGRSEP